MSAFIIVQINVTNKKLYKEYLKVVTPTVKNYGGEYLIRGGKYKVLLGEWNYERTVIIRFSTFKIAIDWYNSKEYAPIKKIREDNSKGNAIIIEGN